MTGACAMLSLQARGMTSIWICENGSLHVIALHRNTPLNFCLLSISQLKEVLQSLLQTSDWQEASLWFTVGSHYWEFLNNKICPINIFCECIPDCTSIASWVPNTDIVWIGQRKASCLMAHDYKNWLHDYKSSAPNSLAPQHSRFVSRTALQFEHSMDSAPFQTP